MAAWKLIQFGSLAPQEDPEGNPEMELIHFRVPYGDGTLMAYPLRLFKAMKRWVPKPALRHYKWGECIPIDDCNEPNGKTWKEGTLKRRH
jgi:hypothetical protein